MRTNFPVVGVVFLLFGVVFGGVGGVLLRTEATRSADFLPADGTVTELEWGANGSRPVVRFVTASGEPRTVRGTVWSRPPAEAVGEHLPVRYSANSPDAVLDSAAERWLLPGVFGGLGAVFFLVGAGVLALRRQERDDGAATDELRELAQARPRLDDFNVFKVVGLIFASLGLAFLVGGGVWVRSELKGREGFDPAPGTVVDLVLDSAGFAAPVVEFAGPDGRVHRFNANVWTRPPAYERGEAVKVQFRRARPDDALLDSFFALWDGPAVLLGLGLICSVLGGLVLFFSRDETQRAPGS